MVFYSFTLAGALCALRFCAFTSFFGFKDQQRTTATLKNIFHEGHLYNGRYTQLTCLSEACQALRYDCQFAFHYLQTTYFYPL